MIFWLKKYSLMFTAALAVFFYGFSQGVSPWQAKRTAKENRECFKDSNNAA